MILNKKEKRIKRVRAKISGSAARPRLAVYRSNQQIYAQLIDDQKGQTLVASSSLKVLEKMTPIQKAKLVGEELADKAIKAKITTAVFDRRDRKYHGQIKALAEAVRAKGLQI